MIIARGQNPLTPAADKSLVVALTKDSIEQLLTGRMLTLTCKNTKAMIEGWQIAILYRENNDEILKAFAEQEKHGATVKVIQSQIGDPI